MVRSFAFFLHLTSSLFPLCALCEFECGQNAFVTNTPSKHSLRASAETVTIDYAVFYTPEAAATQGGTDQMLARIQSAFAGANQLFASSGSSITHRVVHTEELPLNNTSQTLPELNTELAQGFDFFSALDAANADSTVIVVNFQIPGGFANIPGSPGQALRGGSINLGLPNLSASVLAHEIGHTLGVSHDYPDALHSAFFIPPTYPYGNHFIGAGSGNCYRTIMSALTTCRVTGFENLPAESCNLFSNPSLQFDGTPTGNAEKADAVRMFGEFGPFVASARGDSQVPTPTPGSDNGGGGGGDSGQDTLTLKIAKKKKGLIANGKCQSDGGSALSGDSIEIYLINRKSQTSTLLQTATCTSVGKYRARLSRGGRIQAKNARTSTQSDIVNSKKL